MRDPKKFKYISHTADAQFQAFGKTLEEAFENSVLAFCNIMYDTSKIKPKKTVRISAEDKDTKSLLYDFLEELIILLEDKSFIVNKVKSIKVADGQATAELVGDKYDAYDVGTLIKAVTYSDMEIKQKRGKWTTQVVVDI